MTDRRPVVEMSQVVFDAFLLHLEETIRAEVHAEIEEADRAAWEPIREHLRRTRSQPTWEERLQTRRATRQQEGGGA